ncbi:MAG: glycosyltransferase [Flavobacteriales bacterium]|nr:glycosyltransferase [Flavobacteriales bacterium]
MEKPLISIVIPTINRYGDLQNTLNDLQKQSVREYEVLIIDQTDEKDFCSIHFPQTKHLHKTFKSASKARNIGLLEAQAPIVLFLDDDVIIETPYFLKNHIRHYEDMSVSGVSGAILNTDRKWNTHLPQRASHPYLGWIYTPRNYHKPLRISDGGAGNLSVRKEWAIGVGGMDEHYEKGAYREESDFCIRFTNKYGKLIYDPEAVLIHIGNPKGGIRSWKTGQGIIHAPHHMFGAWYFMFRNLPWFVWPEYSWLTVRRFILHKKLLKNFYLFPKAIYWFGLNFLKAMCKSINKPLFISTITHKQ